MSEALCNSLISKKAEGVIKTVIVTDCMYRSAIAAIHTLHRLGEVVVAVTTNSTPFPPAFRSRYVKDKYVLSSEKDDYTEKLIEICSLYDRPIILPIGVFTLNIISENIDRFREVADFAVGSRDVLDRLNDKKMSKQIAIESGIAVPKKTDSFPMVVKPFCGEKFGLKASDRYKIVNNDHELSQAVELFSKYDSSPIIEEYVDGYGVGVSVVIGNDGKERSAFCHRRLSEYPSSGGPSCSLVTFYDSEIIKKSVNMLKNAGFIGIAMVEYKVRNGEYYFLEVNPRIWGSFGATFKADSDFIKGYLSASTSSDYAFNPTYKIKKVKFMPNIAAAVLSYLKSKKYRQAFESLLDTINPFVPNAIFDIKDPMPSIVDIFRKRR